MCVVDRHEGWQMPRKQAVECGHELSRLDSQGEHYKTAAQYLFVASIVFAAFLGSSSSLCTTRSVC